MKCLSFFDNDLIFPLWVEKQVVARAQITQKVMRGPAELPSTCPSQPTRQDVNHSIRGMYHTVSSHHGKVFMQSPSATGQGHSGHSGSRTANVGWASLSSELFFSFCFES